MYFKNWKWYEKHSNWFIKSEANTRLITSNETVLGFPFKDFKAIVLSLEFLNQKAIPNSRGKNALAMLKRKEAEKISQTDPFQK